MLQQSNSLKGDGLCHSHKSIIMSVPTSPSRTPFPKTRILLRCRCQEALLDSMHMERNIARNAALRENVFMMAVCVELRIPLFLVGKPGSSKSLAKSIISESMRGKNSRTLLLKKFKEVITILCTESDDIVFDVSQVGIFSYQCSQLSTPDSVIEVFNTASKFQSKQDRNSYVAVVVLDEVGLAEDSPNLPLKALHPLLEDGTEGAKKDFTDQVCNF